MSNINQDIFKEFHNDLNEEHYISGKGPITSLLKFNHEYHKACGGNLNLFKSLLIKSNKYNNLLFPNYSCVTGYNINKNNIWYNCSDELLLNGDNTVLSLTSKRGNKESILFTFGNKHNINNISIKVAELGCDKAKHDTQPSSLKNGRGIGLLHKSCFYLYSNNDNRYRVKVSFELCDEYIDYLKTFASNNKIPKNSGKWALELTGVILLKNNKSKSFEYMLQIVYQHAKVSGIKRCTYLPIITAVLQTNEKYLINHNNIFKAKGKAGFAQPSSTLKIKSEMTLNNIINNQSSHVNYNSQRNININNNNNNSNNIDEDIDLKFTENDSVDLRSLTKSPNMLNMDYFNGNIKRDIGTDNLPIYSSNNIDEGTCNNATFHDMFNDNMEQYNINHNNPYQFNDIPTLNTCNDYNIRSPFIGTGYSPTLNGNYYGLNEPVLKKRKLY